MLRSLDEGCARLVPATVVVEAEGRVGTGFFVGVGGALVTSFGTIADASAITVRLPSGRRLVVGEVLGVDTRRNVAVLRAPAPSAGGLPLATEFDRIHPGLVVFAQAAPGDPTAVVMTRTGSIERIGGTAPVCLLPGLAADSAAGSPLLADDGRVVGVATRVLSSVGPLAVGVAARDVLSLLQGPPRGLSVLQTEARRRRPVKRSIPSHPLSLLDSSSPKGIEAIGAALIGAIQTGAPAYNEGDVDGCYRVYEETAKKLLQERDDCPGPQRALRDGLTRAAALGGDVNAQAWAMRDTFDGLLLVIERWNEAKSLYVPATAPKKSAPN